MEAKNYLSLLQHWAWLLITGLVLGAISAYGFSSYQTPVYSASTRVQVISAPKGTGTDFTYISDQQLSATYVQTLKTRPILELVSQKLGYEVRANQISASSVANTQLIDITIEDGDAQRAADIANTLVDVFTKRNSETQALRFADSEASLKTQISQIETQITTLQDQSSAVTDAALQENITKTKSEMDRLQKEIITLKSDLAVLNSNITRVGWMTATPEPEVAAQSSEKQFQLDQLQNTYDQYSQIYTNLVILGKSAIGTDSNSQQMQSTMALYQQIRANLLSSYENIRLARLNSTSNIISIEPATAPLLPIRPKVLNNTGLGAVVGLMLAGAIAFLIEYLDDTLKTAEQIGQALGLPVIGYIAEMEADHAAAYVSENPRSPVSEAFRTLRANLDFSSVDQPLRSLLVVSAHPSEGKSTIAANLAITLAQGGKRVVLLDADLRRPNVHRFFALTNRAGLSDLFREAVSLSDVTRVWQDPLLQIVTSGDIPPNPADLLGSKKMESILAAAKAVSDIVIVDSPPFLVADASILASRVDGVLLVVQPGKTPTDAALTTIDQLKLSGARVIGVVMNRIPRNRPYYYGGYRHYTAYYKGDYYYYDTTHKKSSRSGRRKSGNSILASFTKKSEKSKPGTTTDSTKKPE